MSARKVQKNQKVGDNDSDSDVRVASAKETIDSVKRAGAQKMKQVAASPSQMPWAIATVLLMACIYLYSNQAAPAVGPQLRNTRAALDRRTVGPITYNGLTCSADSGSGISSDWCWDAFAASSVGMPSATSPNPAHPEWYPCTCSGKLEISATCKSWTAVPGRTSDSWCGTTCSWAAGLNPEQKEQYPNACPPTHCLCADPVVQPPPVQPPPVQPPPVQPPPVQPPPVQPPAPTCDFKIVSLPSQDQKYQDARTKCGSGYSLAKSSDLPVKTKPGCSSFATSDAWIETAGWNQQTTTCTYSNNDAAGQKNCNNKLSGVLCKKNAVAV